MIWWRRLPPLLRPQAAPPDHSYLHIRACPLRLHSGHHQSEIWMPLVLSRDVSTLSGDPLTSRHHFPDATYGTFGYTLIARPSWGYSARRWVGEGRQMVQSQLLHMGDRVQTTRPLAGLPLGSTGTIRQVFPDGEFYDVRFDGKLLPRLVHCSALGSVAAVLRAREVGS
jgi:hypothetical protein